MGNLQPSVKQSASAEPSVAGTLSGSVRDRPVDCTALQAQDKSSFSFPEGKTEDVQSVYIPENEIQARYDLILQRFDLTPLIRFQNQGPGVKSLRGLQKAQVRSSAVCPEWCASVL